MCKTLENIPKLSGARLIFARQRSFGRSSRYSRLVCVCMCVKHRFARLDQLQASGDHSCHSSTPAFSTDSMWLLFFFFSVRVHAGVRMSVSKWMCGLI